MLLLVAGFCCKKDEYVPTDPATGTPITNLTVAGGDCYIAKIAQKNKDNAKNDNAFVIVRDTSFVPKRMTYYDSLTGKVDYDIQVTIKGDTVKLNTGEYFIIDKTTKMVKSFSTKADITDVTSDNQLYVYQYSTEGYLTRKLAYINGANTPTYESDYTYDNNHLLTGCILYAGAKKIKSLESVILHGPLVAFRLCKTLGLSRIKSVFK